MEHQKLWIRWRRITAQNCNPPQAVRSNMIVPRVEPLAGPNSNLFKNCFKLLKLAKFVSFKP
jgi:hypothetical protein